MSKKISGLQRLINQGFDRTTKILFEKGYYICCSQCQALAINGMATHETGCPNQKYRCQGNCGNYVPHKGTYCKSCTQDAE